MCIKMHNFLIINNKIIFNKITVFIDYFLNIIHYPFNLIDFVCNN